jgi:glutaredoxin-like YruB-family protein
MPEQKNIIIYTTPVCPWCHRAKEYLSSKGFSYTDYDVASDREKAKEMIQKSGQMAVPVIVIGEEIIVGFNQTRIDELLAK